MDHMFFVAEGYKRASLRGMVACLPSTEWHPLALGVAHELWVPSRMILNGHRVKENDSKARSKVLVVVNILSRKRKKLRVERVQERVLRKAWVENGVGAKSDDGLGVGVVCMGKGGKKKNEERACFDFYLGLH